ncbi:pimeloyl-ACP methyl ester carboxylesterase [Sinobaca qinghaiensis]|uniref:Pimeloyl-ACP methyl ester carboxylesterase n=1 Tax=Sinobaca qinghaiensis TaxID=342944 RepID=A0A419V406_9BACL|nr:alpha/beta hydrolase [Sinobaca qinghaiensis]RKD73223.1 pimeloyl-ACP methyl ester carboxylesterase [Sinobaca qinghaiensis]
MKNSINQSQTDKSSVNEAPVGHYYRVKDRRLLLDRAGIGSPAVVFLPAAGMIGLDYLNIHKETGKHTTSVIYDRAGTGWSDQVKLPRSAREVTNELQHLLHAADIPAPYLFVGHSLGGIYAQRYAQRFPEETAGMLLLEPPHEDFLTNTPTFEKRYLPGQAVVILRTLLTYKQSFRRIYEQMFTGWPDTIRKPLIDYHLRTLSKTMTERKNLKSELYAELREGGSLPNIPLLVFSVTEIDPFTKLITSPSFLRRFITPFNNSKKIIYSKLAASVKYGEHHILNNAGHATIHTDSPDEILKAIQYLLDLSKAAKS